MEAVKRLREWGRGYNDYSADRRRPVAQALEERLAATRPPARITIEDVRNPWGAR